MFTYSPSEKLTRVPRKRGSLQVRWKDNGASTSTLKKGEGK